MPRRRAISDEELQYGWWGPGGWIPGPRSLDAVTNAAWQGGAHLLGRMAALPGETLSAIGAGYTRGRKRVASYRQRQEAARREWEKAVREANERYYQDVETEGEESGRGTKKITKATRKKMTLISGRRKPKDLVKKTQKYQRKLGNLSGYAPSAPSYQDVYRN
jgi:hypothetical protein